MTLVLNGTNGLSDVDGSAATPAIRGTDANTGIFFPAADTIAFSTAGTEDARFDSAGNFGIGTSSPNSYGSAYRVLQASATDSGIIQATGTTNSVTNEISTTGVIGQVGTRTNHVLAFKTNDTERARIDTSGNLLVGTASANARVSIEGTVANANTGNLYVRSNAAGDVSSCAASFVKQDNNSTTSQIFIRFGINGYSSGCGQINAYGAGAAAFGAFSDRRLKENIVDLPSQLDNIMALRTVEFDYIESEGGGHQIGFVAQEVQEIYPDLVGERADGMLTLTDLNKNDARLIKAIQEMKAIIDTQASTITTLTDRVSALDERLTALEAKP
jgi:hypothetical protein